MYCRMDQVKFVEDSRYLGRPYHFKFFKGSLPQIFLGPFLNTLSYISNKLQRKIPKKKKITALSKSNIGEIYAIKSMYFFLLPIF